MYQVTWKDELKVDISLTNHPEEDRFLVVVGDGEIPINTFDITNGMFAKMFWRHYVEWNVKIFRCHFKSCTVSLAYETKFNPQNQNIYFNLFPESQSELNIWIDYLNNFCELKKCNAIVKNNSLFDLKNTEKISIVESEQGVDYYAKYNISWSNDLHFNPLRLKTNDSYSLINNCLLKL